MAAAARATNRTVSVVTWATASELSQLARERKSLVEKMAEAQGEKQAAHAEMLKAQERFHSAFAEEARFRKQMDMNPRYADEAIAVEEREIVRSDSKEQAELGPPSFESFP